MLTGTIDPLSFNSNTAKRDMNSVLNNVDERLQQYESAISRYITDSYFTDIVFVENSGYPFPAEKYEKLAIRYGKNFEFLYRKLSEEEVTTMLNRGKSWGEADLIDYAMINSELISKTEVVYKVTGRVYLKNSKSIIKSANNESEFMKYRKYEASWTVFFKILKHDYFSYVQLEKNEVNDYEPEDVNWYDKNYIEHCYYLRMKNSDMKVKAFKYYPDLEGINGAHLYSYNTQWVKRIAYNILPKCFWRSLQVK